MSSEPAAATTPDGLRDAVHELYGLLPTEFTAARNARAATARNEGDKELSGRIKALPKPTAGAWLVNALVRLRPEETAEVLELGAALREAQEDLDPREMRRLSTERQRLLRAMARSARELAGQLDHPVSGAVAAEVEQTLWAAMTDSAAAAAVAGGRLVRSLTATGWGSVDLDGSVAAPELADSQPSVRRNGQHASRSGAAGTGNGQTDGQDAGDGGHRKAGARSAEEKRRKAERARALRSARAELDAAEQSAAETDRDFAALQSEVEDLATERDAVADDLEDLREQVRRLEQELTGLDRRAGTLERRRDIARRSARAANRAAERARNRVHELEEDR